MERSFSLEIFLEKKQYLQKYSSFLGLTGIIGVSLYHLRHHTSTMLFDEMRGLFEEKLYCSIWLKILTGFSIQTESAPC